MSTHLLLVFLVLFIEELKKCLKKLDLFELFVFNNLVDVVFLGHTLLQYTFLKYSLLKYALPIKYALFVEYNLACTLAKYLGRKLLLI